MQPLARVTTPMAPPRMTPTDTRRPNVRPARRSLLPAVIKGMILVSAIGSLVWQRQSLSDEWTRLQRHGVAQEWAAIERKASDLWVEIRSRLPLGEDEESTSPVKTTSRSHASDRDPTRATRGTHHQPQVAERSTKRKGKTKQREDLNGPGNTP